MKMEQDRDTYVFIDSHGDIWRLRPTHDPEMPLTIELEHRHEPFFKGEYVAGSATGALTLEMFKKWVDGS